MSSTLVHQGPITVGWLSRIKQDALRGIGASSGDTTLMADALGVLQRDPAKVDRRWLDAMANILDDQLLTIEELRATNAKLSEHLAERLVDSTMLTGITPVDGGLSIGLEGGACALFAEMFGDQFVEVGGVNYVEASFSSKKHPQLGPLVVTIQRVEGKTPNDLRREAEMKLVRLGVSAGQ